MNKLTKHIERFAPPGSNYQQILYYLLLTALFSSFYSLGYFTQYADHYYDIFDRITGVLKSYQNMPPLEDLLYLDGFYICAAAAIAFVVSNYLYFYQGSKSIYTMHRLRSSWELHLRCWALPVLSAVILLILAFLLYCLYALHYFQATPAELIPVQNTIFGR